MHCGILRELFSRRLYGGSANMASWRESGPDMAGPFWRDVDELEKAGCVPDIPTQALRVESLRSRGGGEGEAE